MSDGDRADRLRRRRQRARDRAQEGPADGDDAEEAAETEEITEEAETENPPETAKPSKTDGTDEMGETDGAEERDEMGETDESTETDEIEGTDEAVAGDDGGEVPTTSVKDEQKPTYMYLPHDVRRNLDRAYTMLKADYEYEFDESFEKNRHFYPLVVSLGLDAMDELDAESVRERLEDVE